MSQSLGTARLGKLATDYFSQQVPREEKWPIDGQPLDRSDPDVRLILRLSSECLGSTIMPRISLVLAAECPVPCLPRAQVHLHVPVRQRRYKTTDGAGALVFRAVHRFRLMGQGRKKVEFGLPTMASEHC